MILFEDLEENPYQIIKELETFIGTNYYTESNFSLQKKNIRHPENDERKRIPISTELNTFLRNHYQQHNDNLAKFLNRDLSYW